MFIKKDLRKIPKILDDAVECDTFNNDDDEALQEHTRDKKRAKVEEPLSELRLGRRQQEFQGSVRILCQPKYLPKLQQLQKVNLYDCGISDLSGIGVLGQCPQLEILNLGRNPLTSLPDELSELSNSLKELWLDDCKIQGSLPPVVTQLHQLELLRIPKNQINHIPETISNMINLRILCLDRNPLSDGRLPDLAALTQLEQVLVRHTDLQELPALPASLQLLHASSNPLTHLDSLALPSSGSHALKVLYVNGCQLERLSTGILQNCPNLEKMVISHNSSLKELPMEVWDAIDNSSTPEIVWEPNPQLERPSGALSPTASLDTDEEDNDGDVRMAATE